MATLLCRAQGSPGLITDFRQTSALLDAAFTACSKEHLAGNCATIALIKAALAEFGSANAVFATFCPATDSTRCTFRDGTRAAVGPDELATVRAMAGIGAAQGYSSLFQEEAIAMYALICKRMWLLQSDFTSGNGSKGACVKNFTNAVSLLDSGYPTPDAYRLLALDAVQITDYRLLATTPSAIIYADSHAAFCTMGQQDRFGTAFTIYQLRKKRQPTNCWMMGGALKRGNISKSRIMGAYRLTLPRQ